MGNEKIIINAIILMIPFVSFGYFLGQFMEDLRNLKKEVQLLREEIKGMKDE